MKRLTITFFTLTLYITVLAQATRSSLNSAYSSMGVYSNRFSDVFSGAANQASLARVKNFAAGVYAERQYMLKDLAYYQAIIALPSKHGGFALSLHYSGAVLFNESKLGFGYGRQLSEKIDFGIRINYNIIRIAGYGNSGALNAEIGCLWHITDQLHLGVHVYNPVGGKFGNDAAEKLPAVYTSGLGYEVSEKVFISTEIVKEENQPVNINAGLQYNFIDQFFMRVGLATTNGQFFLAAGIKWDELRIDLVGAYHQQLGLTPSIVFIFGLREEK